MMDTAPVNAAGMRSPLPKDVIQEMKLNFQKKEGKESQPLNNEEQIGKPFQNNAAKEPAANKTIGQAISSPILSFQHQSNMTGIPPSTSRNLQQRLQQSSSSIAQDTSSTSADSPTFWRKFPPRFQALNTPNTEEASAKSITSPAISRKVAQLLDVKEDHFSQSRISPSVRRKLPQRKLGSSDSNTQDISTRNTELSNAFKKVHMTSFQQSGTNHTEDLTTEQYTPPSIPRKTLQRLDRGDTSDAEDTSPNYSDIMKCEHCNCVLFKKDFSLHKKDACPALKDHKKESKSAQDSQGTNQETDFHQNVNDHQGLLSQELEKVKACNTELREQNTQLQRRVEDLEKIVQNLSLNTKRLQSDLDLYKQPFEQLLKTLK